MPRVSIITPLLNKGPWIRETLESVGRQTIDDWEHLVVDGGSTDGGPAIVAECERARLLQNPGGGPGSSRNVGLRAAKGEWVLFLDADDLLEPDHLECLLAAAARAPEAGIVAGGWQEFTDAHPADRVLKQPTPADGLRESAIAFAPWAVHAALVRRAMLPDPAWPEELDPFLSEDTAFWFRLIARGAQAAYAPETAGALYRKHTPGARDAVGDPERWLAGIRAVVAWNVRLLEEMGCRPSAAQCEYLMRAFEAAAARSTSRNAANEALAEADFWLEQAAVAGSLRTSMWLRKKLGLRNFLKLSAIFHR